MIAALLVAGLGMVLRPAPALSSLPRGPVLDRAVERGVLRVGVRSYPRPAPPEAPTPPEPDSFDATLAARLAESLGVRLELVGLAPAAQAGALREGAVDLLLAGVPAPAAGEEAFLAAGRYDPGGATIVALRKGRIQNTDGLRGATVCTAQGSAHANLVARRYGALPKPYPSAVHAVSAFMAGECPALVEDDEVLERLLRDEQWRFYRPIVRSMTAGNVPLARLRSADEASRNYLAQVLRRWSEDGTLDQARTARAGNLQLEITLLKDGLVCHS
ncbi:substrate-binding periplasmic protein [Variovorax ginsengisoli]|uniref:Polar amino acid transport system substrate-binding protein n=1 Tax=Variovorax ginsengisoli TaxID=363844 RepID=A0ABT9S306_9BURK|nr:transporter substrate-binding domain-containing protein [Variovorax ginsengisoli]MDP9898716.1 polar amino acid transport system substrate-binding protein [Variovorax ginsengisoli]